MKYISYILLLSCAVAVSQQRVSKHFFSDKLTVHINASGLDEVLLEESRTEAFEIILLDEHINAHQIQLEDLNDDLKIEFIQPFSTDKSAIFRKFITRRIHRASVIIKVPKNKVLFVYGGHVDVISKSYHGDINIFIDKGLVNLHDVQRNATVKLFQGHVIAHLSNTAINIVSKYGDITVNTVHHDALYQLENTSSSHEFNIESLHANVNVQYGLRK
mgnify:CR=1 FL=1